MMMAGRQAGLLVVSHAREALVHGAGLLLAGDGVEWTVVNLLSAGDPDAEVLRETGASWGFRVIEAGFTDRGPVPSYSRDAAPLGRLVRDLLAAGRFQVVATHSRGQSREHPFRWHVYNAVVSRARGTKVLGFGPGDRGQRITPPLSGPARDARDRLFGRLGVPPAGLGEVYHPVGGESAEYAALRRLMLHGQIVQPPMGDSPGVLISPFWDIPRDRAETLGRLLQDEAAAGDWYLVMGDTCFCNRPPPPLRPLVRGRFCVDDAERRFFTQHFPDIDCLEVCQSHFLSPERYHPLPGVAKDFDLVYNGRFGWVKRHELLLDALEVLHARGTPLRCLFLYYPKDDADTRETTARVLGRLRNSPLDVTLHTTGARGNDEAQVVELLNRCRFGVLMSPVEGPSLVFAEYLLCDLPVVACATLQGGGLYFLNASNSRLFQGADDLPDVLLWMRDHYRAFQPRASALAQGIGPESGNGRLRQELARHGIHLRSDAEPARRNLSQYPLRALLMDPRPDR
jgi:glycosyltransferase involved in cell wall biosynthesis